MDYNLKIPTTISENLDFIKLTNRKLAEYNIIYHINDGFKTSDFQNFKFKEQLLFQKFENHNQQLNLMLVDSVFPIILADIALLVFLGKIKSLDNYINSDERITFPRIVNDIVFSPSKIKGFINALMYGEVGGDDSWNGETNNQRIFCRRNSNGELEYYSIYDRKELFELLINKMILEIESIEWFNDNKTEVSLRLRMKF